MVRRRTLALLAACSASLPTPTPCSSASAVRYRRPVSVLDGEDDEPAPLLPPPPPPPSPSSTRMSPRMTLRLTPDGRADVRRMEMMGRPYHRHRREGTVGKEGAGRGRGHVDYGGRHPYDRRLREERRQQSEETVITTTTATTTTTTTTAEEERAADPTAHGRQHHRRKRRRRRRLRNPDAGQRRASSPDDENDAWQPIRIWVNTDYLDLTITESSPFDQAVTTDKVNFLKNEVFPQAIARWSDLLRVVPADRIEIDKDGDCPGFGIAVGYDLVVFAFADCGDGTPPGEEGGGDYGGGGGDGGGGRMASGRSCQSDDYDRPVAGFTGICLDTFDLGSEKDKQEVHETVMHEFAHVLGFYGPDFAYYRNPVTGERRTPVREERTVTCSDGRRRSVVVPDEGTVRGFADPRGALRYEITTETVRAVVRNQFDCQELTGAWLENSQSGGAEEDCFGSHWDFRLFSTEFMTASATSTAQYLSPLTLALLEDSGWYRANYGGPSSISPFGHLAGCDFVREKCIVDGQVPSYSLGSFCTGAKPLGCDPSHRNVAHCSEIRYDADLPFEYQYYSDPRVGGKNEDLDYCPVYGTTKFFGLASTRDEADSFEIDCTDPSLQGAPFAYDVETYGEAGRCFDTDYDRPLCLRAYCSEERHAVQVLFGNQIATCLNDGQRIQIPGLANHRFTCPRLAQMCPDLVCGANCAGRGVCDTRLADPECVCNDPSDDSPFCENSPVVANLEQAASVLGSA